MTEHIAIQDPDDYSPEDLMRMAEHLFAPLTPVAELERICMILAHLPTQDAQDLLARFKVSPRAGEVGWLECAIDEGTYLLLEPTNTLEEREYLTLKADLPEPPSNRLRFWTARETDGVREASRRPRCTATCRRGSWRPDR